MKVKQAREDFVVEEVIDLAPRPDGAFALYRLDKTGIGTLEALRVLERAWRVPRRDVAVAGLKDRHGTTSQTLSIRNGPARDYEGRGFSVRHLGRAARPVGPGVLAGNRFRIVLRDLGEREARRAVERAGDVLRHGVPNYYDDQRFGSLRGTGGAFVARARLAGDDERALRLAVASPSPEDRGRIRARRRLLSERWGAWGDLARRLEPSLERKVAEHLARGATFLDAYALLDRNLRALHLGAWQAHVFNEGLRRHVPPGGPSSPGADGPYAFYDGPPGALATERVPLAHTRAESHPWLDEVLASEGVDRAALARLPFRRGLRAAVLVPREVETGAPIPDDHNPGRLALSLAFVLGPGSYATMIVKRLTFDVPPRGRARRRHGRGR